MVNGGKLVTPSIIQDRQVKKIEKIISKETSDQLRKILRKVVSSEEGTASLADKDGYYVGGKTGTAESYGNKKNRINTFISIFPANKPNYTLFVMLENPKINKDLIYDYRGTKTIAPYNTSGWNSVYVAGKIIEKIGPILAINSEEFTFIRMLLKNLIKNISKNKKNIFISGLSSNSKEIKKNYIFFAIKGNKINGEKFILQAIQKGAAVIVCSRSCNIKNNKVLIIKTNKIRNLLSEVASKFYPLKPKNIFAVTGTNGKTSVADIFYQILEINKIPVATIGTLGIKCKGKIIKTNLTSPDTISLHKYLHYLKKKKIDNVLLKHLVTAYIKKECIILNLKQEFLLILVKTI